MALKLTDLSPFRDQADLKTSVASWRQLAAELEADERGNSPAASTTHRGLKRVWHNALDAVRPRKSTNKP